MDPKTFFRFKNLLLLLLHHCTMIIMITFTTSAIQVLCLDPKFEACSPRTCGNIGPRISYPFWISHEQDPFCGYPSFGITCNDNSPVLTISDDDYIIKDIFYGYTSLLVVNSLAYEESCPIILRNLTLDRTPFNFSTNTDLLIWYNCTEDPPRADTTYSQNCSGNNNSTLHSFASFHEDVVAEESSSVESCQSLVYSSVHLENGGDDDEMASLRNMNYTEILKMGFLLNWTANNCSSCEASGGRCGFSDNEFFCFCPDRPHLETCDDGVSAALGGIFICIIICIWRRKRTLSFISTLSFKNVPKNDKDLEAFIKNYGPLAPKRYSFLDVRKMSNSFQDGIGQGGYGSVYKGKLPDGRLVAVKLLNVSKGKGQEFINEVASISKTSHVNVVTLLGFCLEGKNRALVYEFMPNGSLEKFIYKGDKSEPSRHYMGWDKMYEIVVGIARGLEYLHCGCNTRILHLDIKPHNILLDKDFVPKISDFGLAKLYREKESIVSIMEARGTFGYIAPEVFSRSYGEVSHKSDVYSYGMTIMELVGCRNNRWLGTDHSSEIYFPDRVYQHVAQGKEIELPGAVTAEESRTVRKMILVGLWCIQTRPSDRPPMNRVIEMLRGSLEALETPPMPLLSSPPRAPTFSSTISTY